MLATMATELLDEVRAAALRDALATSGPFAVLAADARAELADRATRCDYEPGEEIVRVGEAGDAMYVVLAGATQVYLEDEGGRTRVLARLEPGAFFGEQALLPGRDGRRNANVRAHRPTTL